MPTQYQVVVTIQTAAADVERVVGGWGMVERLDERSCRLRMNVDSFDWPAMVLAVVGADFDVLAPPDLREYVRRMGSSSSAPLARLGHREIRGSVRLRRLNRVAMPTPWRRDIAPRHAS